MTQPSNSAKNSAHKPAAKSAMKAADLAQLTRELDNAEPGDPNALAYEAAMLRSEVRRLKAALPAPPPVESPIVEDWIERLPRHPSEVYARRSLADIFRLIIHHSAVPAEIGVETIARFQIEKRGWPAIGYHYFITPAGGVLQTNPLDVICFHTRHGSETSVGICLAGRFETGAPPEPQLHAAAQICASLCGRLGLFAGLGGILGHGELTKTDCPGAQWADGARWKDHLLRKVLELQDGSRRRQTRALGHYLLFWQDAETWDVEGWEAAQNYIGRWRPVCGFSIEAASQAEYVTIVGDEERFPPGVESHLRDAGCIVERISERGAMALRQAFDSLNEQGRRFQTIDL